MFFLQIYLQASIFSLPLLQTDLYEEAEASNRDNLQLIKTVCQALVSHIYHTKSNLAPLIVRYPLPNYRNNFRQRSSHIHVCARNGSRMHAAGMLNIVPKVGRCSSIIHIAIFVPNFYKKYVYITHLIVLHLHVYISHGLLWVEAMHSPV